jgi:predicted AAA+ superfamily ATPase
MIKRDMQNQILTAMQRQPSVALLGPRQVGKTTLARALPSQRSKVYLDLEVASDRAKLVNPAEFIRAHPDKLIIFDEIALQEELFSNLRGIIDAERHVSENQSRGRFLMLGSASLDLLHQSSQSLAGRIAYLELGPLNVAEVAADEATQRHLWVRGGFPGSFLAADDASSLAWRQDFVRTYLERDVPLFGPRVPAETLRRLWTMLAHLQGSNLNATKLATGLGISNVTVGRYLDLLVDLLLVRRLPPWSRHIGKRLVKSPKIYLRDSGLVHVLLGIANFDALLGHPVVGGSWEGYVLEQVSQMLPFGAEMFFYRSASGEEIDLLISFASQEIWAIEIKRSLLPHAAPGFYAACKGVQPVRQYLVHPGEGAYPLSDGLVAVGLRELMLEIQAA